MLKVVSLVVLAVVCAALIGCGGGGGVPATEPIVIPEPPPNPFAGQYLGLLGDTNAKLTVWSSGACSLVWKQDTWYGGVDKDGNMSGNISGTVYYTTGALGRIILAGTINGEQCAD